MIKRLAGYLVLLLAAAYLYFMYNETVISGILVFLTLYLPVSALYLILIRGRVDADLGRVPPMGEEGKKIRAGAVVRNRSHMVNIHYEVFLTLGNTHDKKRKRRKYAGAVPAGGEETLWCEFETGRCGSIEVRLDSIRVYDFLGIFFLRKKVKRRAAVKILPRFSLMSVEITRKTREFQAEADEYSGEKRGDDPSEIYQIREYRVMDSLKDIHWKLSAKEEELMVKERGFPLGCTVLIWFDVRAGKLSAEGFSKMIERAASLSVTLAAEKCIHMAAWYEEKNEQIVMQRVRDEESACSMVWRLLDLEPCRDIKKRDACYENTFRGREFSSIVTIDGEGKIWKDGEMPELLRL